jgi:hypothetical protein
VERLCQLIYSRAAGYARMAPAGLPHSPRPTLSWPRRWVSLRRGLFPEADLPMDDLTARLADIFQRYMIDFRCVAIMSEAEVEEVTEPFRNEVGALIAEHGRDAVVRAALLLPAALSIKH